MFLAVVQRGYRAMNINIFNRVYLSDCFLNNIRFLSVAIPEAWTFWKKEPVLWVDFSYELPTQTVMCPSGSSSSRNRYHADWFITSLALLWRSIEICIWEKLEMGVTSVYFQFATANHYRWIVLTKSFLWFIDTEVWWWLGPALFNRNFERPESLPSGYTVLIFKRVGWKWGWFWYRNDSRWKAETNRKCHHMHSYMYAFCLTDQPLT